MIESKATHNTLISLREYVDIRFDAQEKAVTSALAAADRAVSKAELASEKRFESVNEFRAALGDSARLLMPRAEIETMVKSLNEKIDVLTARANARDERGIGANWVWALVVAVIGIVTSVATVAVISHK